MSADIIMAGAFPLASGYCIIPYRPETLCTKEFIKCSWSGSPITKIFPLLFKSSKPHNRLRHGSREAFEHQTYPTLTQEHYHQHRQHLVEHGIVNKRHAPSTKNNISGLKKVDRVSIYDRFWIVSKLLMTSNRHFEYFLEKIGSNSNGLLQKHCDFQEVDFG
jgi:hypothetical protein